MSVMLDDDLHRWSFERLLQELAVAQDTLRSALAFSNHELSEWLVPLSGRTIQRITTELMRRARRRRPPRSLQRPKGNGYDREAIVARADWLEVYQHYLPLDKRGKTWIGFCPFHNDKRHPNFHVSSENWLWNCTPCGKGGDAIRFVMMVDQLGFPDALARIAQICSIPEGA